MIGLSAFQRAMALAAGAIVAALLEFGDQLMDHVVGDRCP